jgi:hypothetical protein
MDKLITTIPVRINQKTREILVAAADDRQLRLSDLVREALAEFIGSHNLAPEPTPVCICLERIGDNGDCPMHRTIGRIG